MTSRPSSSSRSRGGRRQSLPQEFFQEAAPDRGRVRSHAGVRRVQAGLGLTGRMWSYEHHDVEPDMVAFGKKTQVCASSRHADRRGQGHVFHVSSRLNSTWGGTLVTWSAPDATSRSWPGRSCSRTRPPAAPSSWRASRDAARVPGHVVNARARTHVRIDLRDAPFVTGDRGRLRAGRDRDRVRPTSIRFRPRSSSRKRRSRRGSTSSAPASKVDRVGIMRVVPTQGCVGLSPACCWSRSVPAPPGARVRRGRKRRDPVR